MEPEEVARAFDELHTSGKVHHFGVSNHTAAQIELMQKYVQRPLVINQLELRLLRLAKYLSCQRIRWKMEIKSQKS